MQKFFQMENSVPRKKDYTLMGCEILLRKLDRKLEQRLCFLWRVHLRMNGQRNENDQT